MRPLSFIQSVFYHSQIRRSRFFFGILENDKSKGKYTVKGGKTILGRIFSYQEKTGQDWESILDMPYIRIVIAMLDAPSIDYDKDSNSKFISPDSAEDEVNLFLSAFGK